ncbi:MAG: dTDP-4-dehydrorhamnose 3,5-epimerase [Anaerolineales bacterium]|nr:dTDP-4-dehydrorhamnose 3,5-epimerase [Anaerolineales bacterium]
MNFIPTPLEGAFVIEPERFVDDRGFFARTWCQREFGQQGLVNEFVQTNVSYNVRAGTVRGMHYQLPPHSEVKIVRVTRGRIYDVIVDIRPGSPTFLQKTGVELDAENRLSLYVPRGFAHGFQTLADDTEVFYQMSAYYMPDFARGLRWNDPLIDVIWPLPVSVIAERDRTYRDGAIQDFDTFRV